MGVASATSANADTFSSRADDLRDLEEAFPLEPGQCGAVLGLGDTMCLDWVSRPDAFALLWPKIRAGYLLDGLERLDQVPTPPKTVQTFLDEVAQASQTPRNSVGVGQDIRLSGPRITGSGLEFAGELLQLSAFLTEPDSRRVFGRVARPTLRRRTTAASLLDGHLVEEGPVQGEAGSLLECGDPGGHGGVRLEESAKAAEESAALDER